MDVGWIWRDGYRRFQYEPLPPRFLFRVRVREDVVDVWIDNELRVKEHRLEDFNASADNRPGIGVSSHSPGAIFRFRDLKLRRVPAGPARYGAPPAPQ